MINKAKFRGQRFCQGQGSNPVPPSSQPVVIAMNNNNPSITVVTRVVLWSEASERVGPSQSIK